jgi:HD-GYP domain-containing protein (c-di-GMP phosphodiesterase class II)
MDAPTPPNEATRLEVLRSYGILNSATEEVFDALTRLAATICATPIATITLIDESRQWFKSKIGLDNQQTPRETSFCGHAILKPGLMMVPDTLEDPRFTTNPFVTGDPHIRFYCGVPLISQTGFALGTLCVIDRVPRQLNPEQIAALEVLSQQVMAQLELKKTLRELEEHREKLAETVECRTQELKAALQCVESTYDETLQALGAALDLRDNDTAGHSRRVTRYCLEIAKTFGLDKKELKIIERGSYLHDIGKIGIPDSILLKPSKLTSEEKLVMDSHVQIGHDIICGIAFLNRPAEIVLAHQERFDGSGYPKGLAGKQIPFGARIFAVADTLDAMTCDRPYRGALPFWVARKEIADESGRQFDPVIVKAFLTIPEEVWIQIRREVAEQSESSRQVHEVCR